MTTSRDSKFSMINRRSILRAASMLFWFAVVSSVQARAAHADVLHRWSAEGGALDSVGDADGSITGGVSFGTGRSGQGFVFDGLDGKIAFGAATAQPGASDFTISFSIRTTNTAHTQSVLGKREACYFGEFWDIRAAAVGRLSFELYQGTASSNMGTVLPVNDGVFHDVVFLRQGGVLRTYVDRVLNSERDAGPVLDPTNTAEMTAGLGACVDQDGTAPFSGTLDEIVFSDSADPPLLCGDANLNDTVTAPDALGALRTAVGLDSCDLCLCDTNGSGGVSATDALAILQLAVGQMLPVRCPECS